MESTHIRNSYRIYSKKIGFLFLLAILACGRVHAQGENRRFMEYIRPMHFGFTIGTNFSNFKYDFSPLWYNQDTFLRVRMESFPGITLGAVADLHLGREFPWDHMDLRLIPSLVLSQRRVYYTFPDEQGEAFKEVESALIDLPLLFKLKSDRLRNLRFYVIGGGKLSIDLASNSKAAQNPSNPRVAVYPTNFAYEFGTGLDIYFPFFKFSPEIKLSKGINNVLVPGNSVYSTIFERFRSNFIYFSLYFEG